MIWTTPPLNHSRPCGANPAPDIPVPPLIISLTMVGLAPTIPVLQRFEEHAVARDLPHRLAVGRA